MSAENGQSQLREFVARVLGVKIAYDGRFTIYLPNKGRSKTDNKVQVEIANWRDWIIEAMDLLGRVNGGATALPEAEGFWIDQEVGGVKVWEKTVLVYSYIKEPDTFRSNIVKIRDWIHKFGRDTNQGAIFFEFDGFVYEIPSPFPAQH